MDIQLIEDKTVVANDSIVVNDDNGNEILVATLYGTVKKNGSVSYCFNIVNEDVYNANRDSTQAFVDQFILDLNAEAKRLLALTI